MVPDENIEAQLVRELESAIEDTGVTLGRAEIRRFLRARNHDVKKAEEMIRKSVEWKKQVKLDEAMTWKTSKCVQDSFPYFFDGMTKDGRIVFYFPVGRWEVRKMIEEGHKSEMERYIYTTMASLVKAVDKTAHEDFLVIIDLAELSYWKIAHFETMQMVLQVFREYEQNFPERLHQAIVINAPWVLNVIFPLIKPLLTGKTLLKVQIFDSSPDKYLPAIMQHAALNELPPGFHQLNNGIMKSRITSTA